MAKTLAENDILKMVLYIKHGNQVAQNIRYWKVGPIGGATYTDQDAANLLAGSFKLVYPPCIPAAASYRGCSVQVVGPVLYDPVYKADVAVGTAAGDILPLDCSMVINHKTGLGGRRNRGRNYVAFPTEAHNDVDGHPTVAYIALCAAIALTFKSVHTMTGSSANVDLLPIVWPADNPLGRQITSSVVGTEWTTLNSRGHKSSLNLSPI